MAKKVGPFEIDEKLMFKMEMFSGEDVQKHVEAGIDRYAEATAPIWEDYSKKRGKLSFQEGALGGLMFGFVIGGLMVLFISVLEGGFEEDVRRGTNTPLGDIFGN